MRTPSEIDDILLRNREILERTLCEIEQARTLCENAGDQLQRANEILEYQRALLLRANEINEILEDQKSARAASVSE